MSRLDLTRAIAENLSGWHDVHLRALGHQTRYVDGVWSTPDVVPEIFFNAIAFDPTATAVALTADLATASLVAVSDPWARLDLTEQGFGAASEDAWMVRAPDDAPDAGLLDELVIVGVTDPDALDAFERTAELGFGIDVRPRGTWQAPGILDDPDLSVWLGRVDGRPVSVSMSYVAAGVVGVYGVATVPEARGRGYGARMTWQAVSADRSLPAVLQPSELAEPLYARLGFTHHHVSRHWHRSGGSDDD
ncbi:MAG: GNAT family N-acetyltransferase [Candidatus Limnocylindrales bacterium]